MTYHLYRNNRHMASGPNIIRLLALIFDAETVYDAMLMGWEIRTA
jgi:hypothetical protein